MSCASVRGRIPQAAAFLSVLAVSPAAAGAATPTVRISGPAYTLVRTPVARVVLQTPKNSTKLTVRLGGHNVTGSFKRAGSRGYVGSVSWRKLVGPGYASISASVTAGEHETAISRKYLFGSASTGYATLVAPTVAVVRAGVQVRVAVKTRPNLVSAHVSGTRSR